MNEKPLTNKELTALVQQIQVDLRTLTLCVEEMSRALRHQPPTEEYKSLSQAASPLPSRLRTT